MSLLDLYSSGIEGNIQRQLSNPGPAEEPSFSLWSAVSSGVKGIPGGGLEALGSAADLIANLEQRSARTRAAQGVKEIDPAGSKALIDKMQASGQALRRRADEFAPDPATAHRADQVIHGLGRFGAKAVGAIGTLGPAGAVPLGVEEGNTVYQRALVDGIDPETARQLGIVQGGLAAAGAVLPIAGATKLGTVGLVGIGGPGSFIAQEKLSRMILENAGYNEQASMRDPYDPLGLAISTILPGAFGGLHMRGVAKRAAAVESGGVGLSEMTPAERIGLKYNDPRLDAYAVQAAEQYDVPPSILLAIKNAGEKSNPDQISPKGAQGVMQFMPSTAKEMGIADPRDPAQSIDGAAKYLRKLYDAYGSWDAAVAHYNGGGSQAAIVRGGGKPTFPETAAYLERVQKYAAEHAAETGSKSPEAVDAARVRVTDDALARSLPDHPEAQAEVMRAADHVAAGVVPDVLPPPARGFDFVATELEDAYRRPVRGYSAEFKTGEGTSGVLQLTDRGDSLAVNWVDNGRVFEEDKGSGGAMTRAYEAGIALAQEQGKRFTSDSSVTTDAVRVYDALSKRGYEVTKNPNARLAERPEVISPRWMTDDGAPVFEVAPKPGVARRDVQPVHAAPPRADAVVANEPARSALPVSASPTIDPPRAASADAGASGAMEAQRARTVTEVSPDLKVKLPGSDETLTVAAALKRAEEEAKHEKSESDLVKAALDCALSFGG